MRIFWLTIGLVAAAHASEKTTILDGLEQRIDKYFKMCLTIEQRKLCAPDLKIFRDEPFCDPSIASCYNEVAHQRSIKPLFNLWQHIKTDIFSANKTVIIREICRILLVILEQYVIKLLNTSGGVGQELANEISNAYPFTQLVENLESCYNKLAEYLETHQLTGIHLSKKLLIASLVVIILVQQLLWRITWHHPVNANSSGAYASQLGNTIYRA